MIDHRLDALRSKADDDDGNKKGAACEGCP